MIPHYIEHVGRLSLAEIVDDRLYVIKGTVDGDLLKVSGKLPPGFTVIETLDLNLDTRKYERCIHFLHFGSLYGSKIRSQIMRQLLLVDFGSRFIVGPNPPQTTYRYAAKALGERLHRRYSVKRIQLGDPRGFWTAADEPGEYLLIECVG